MPAFNWNEIIGWNEEQLNDLRIVGYSYLKEGKYDIALKFFKSLVLLIPGNPYDIQTLGALYLQMGNNLMALNYIEQALKIDPTHSLTLLNRTKALFALGYKRQGIAQARTLEANPDSKVASEATALILSYT
jgi:tetratricopeptide (TPR) repeat protein